MADSSLPPSLRLAAMAEPRGDEASTPSSSTVPRIAPESDLTGALHEVSNALTVILGWIDRARAEVSAPEIVEQALGIAASRASQARDIVRRAIGAEVDKAAPRSAGELVEDAVTGLSPELRGKGLTLSCDVDPHIEDQLLEPPQPLLQILTNLLLNAISMTAPGGRIEVEARAAGTHVLFAVSDEGPGIPPERRDTLFSAGISTRPGGAGIGLRHSAALARASGAELSLADSTAGARFELRWPIAALLTDREPGSMPLVPTTPSQRPSSEGELPLPPPRQASLDGARVLLVEDDDAVIDLLDTALTARGADVISIRGRGELDGALAAGPFDAALVDLSPIRDDIEGALASVREASEAVRVVLISGSAEQMPSLPEDWVSAWVRKPFEVGEIVRALSAKKD
ncbi:MAG: hybrid sensor histidine kinase/response regulator [Byssovorax sp.]